MRRLGRAIFTAASALSLVPCVAVAALWVRSYWAGDHAFRTAWRHDGANHVDVRRGAVLERRDGALDDGVEIVCGLEQHASHPRRIVDHRPTVAGVPFVFVTWVLIQRDRMAVGRSWLASRNCPVGEDWEPS